MPRLRAELPVGSVSRVPGGDSLRSGAPLVHRCAEIGTALADAFRAIVHAMPADAHTTVGLGRHLAIGKVLASRLLKSLRANDPIGTLHLAPGPEPLRRIVRAAERAGATAPLIRAADGAVDQFETLIREETGDRGTLDAILSGHVPEARVGFELRRKQAAYRAMSQLKGVAARVNIASVFLHPGNDPSRIDVVWVFGTLGIQRLRAGVPVKFASRRVSVAHAPRTPRTLAGEPVDAATGLRDLRLDQYCSTPTPELRVQRAGEVVHYTLAEEGFGPRSAVDLVFAEVNRDEIDRFASPEPPPLQRPRRTYFFAEVPIPTELLLFDLFAHHDVFPGREPALSIYDTALEGIASPNDPARDIDRLDTSEVVTSLGHGLTNVRPRDVAFYPHLLADLCTRLAWNPASFRGWRTRIDYPMYGSQVTLAFEPPLAPRVP